MGTRGVVTVVAPVVVLGGGVAGLVAARRLALAGRPVVLLEPGVLGGRVATGTLAGTPVDLGAESFARRDGTVAELAARLGLGGRIVAPERGGAWVLLADRAAPLPSGGVLGVPSSPLASDVVRVLDRGGAARAYLDRLLPPLKIGRYEHLGPLVRSRMGARVLDRLVAPVVESVYGADPDGVPVDAIAPRLNAAIGATGSLSAAVIRLRALAPAGSAVQSLEGGLHGLVDALVAEVVRLGVDVRQDAAVGIDVGERGRIVVATAAGAIDAGGIVVATDGATAADLLTPVVEGLGGLQPPIPQVTRTVLLAIDDRRLGARPRGSGVLRAAERGDVRATALTHVTAKWGWTARGAHHVLRLSYRGDSPVSDARVAADARALLDVPIVEPDERIDRVWRDTAPPLAAATRALRAAVLEPGALPSGVTVAGSWVSGTGLASAVAGGAAAADGLLRA